MNESSQQLLLNEQEETISSAEVLELRIGQGYNSRQAKNRKEKSLSSAEVLELTIGRAYVSGQPRPGEEFSLTIDYSLSLEQMLGAGRYAWADSEINDVHFPIPEDLLGQRITVTAKLFDFKPGTSNDDIILEMEQQGFNSSPLPGLLSLGAKYPDLQRENAITALGSIWSSSGNQSLIPIIMMMDGRREIGLNWYGYKWIRDCLFLGIRKK